MNKKTKELNRLNNSLDHKVNAENQEAFTDMMCYLRGADISEYDQEVVRQDVLDMVLSAQKRGENISSVIGEDYKAFCDSVIAGLPPKTKKQKVIDFLDIICWIFSILGIINIVISKETVILIRNIVTGKPLSFVMPVSVGSIISMGIVIVAAFVILEVLLKNLFKFQNKKKSTIILKSFLISAGMMGIFLLVTWLGRATLFTVNIFVAFAVVMTLYIAHKILSWLS